MNGVKLLLWIELIFVNILGIDQMLDHFEEVLEKFQNGSGSLKFSAIGKLTKALLAISHSNADVERIFSHVTLIKVKQRLKTCTVNGKASNALSILHRVHS